MFPCVAVLIGGQLEPRMYNFRGSSVRVGAAVLLVLGVGVGLLASPAHAKAKPVKKKAAAPVSSGPVTVTMALDVRVVSDGLVDTFKLAGDYRIDSIPKSVQRAITWAPTSALATATHTTDDTCFHTESSGTGKPAVGPNDGVAFLQTNSGRKYMYAWYGSVPGTYTVSTVKNCVQRIFAGDPTSFVMPVFDDFPGCAPADAQHGLRMYQSPVSATEFSLDCSTAYPRIGGTTAQATVKIVATVKGSPKFWPVSDAG